MRLTRLVLPAALVAAIGAAAYAERPVVHVAEYRLPDGGVARVRYTGDVPPRLVLAPAGDEMASPFAMLDRVAAMMDAQADAMFSGAPAPLDDDAGPSLAALAGQPTGARWTSVSRTVSGGRSCTSEVSMVSQGEGRAPTVVRRTSGDCAAAAAAPAAPAPPAVPKAAATVPHDSI